ncbi:MAG: KPN_02809 family neutral zinc metallopeptidase [Aeromicrobium sp.]
MEAGMRWEGGNRSSNVEDRRGMGMGTIGGGGIGMLLLILTVSCLTGTNPLALLQMAEQVQPGQTQSAPTGVPAQDESGQFIELVLGDTERTWTKIFAANGRQYAAPVLVLFENSVRSGCGSASAASGPFYCPADQKIYLDLSFFRELGQRFGAPGDFAQAYVVAHEVGHHVQHLLGTTRQVRQGDNEASVRLELQADCYAGVVWGHPDAPKDRLEQGDVEEGLAAAAAIGDDRLTKGRVSPESFTHGTSAQRAKWLRQGLSSGNPSSCDTFSSSTF